MDAFDHHEAVERITTLVRSADASELAYGLTWYEDASSTASALAAEHGLTLDQVAGIIAALSPQTAWPQNLDKARELISTGDTYGFGRARSKARRILAGESPDDVLAGPKERAFYETIAAPARATSVVIDRHAYDAVIGAIGTDRSRKQLERKGAYDAVSDVYRDAARLLGLRPHVVQGVVWAVWRNRYGRFHYQHHGATHDVLRPDITEESHG